MSYSELKVIFPNKRKIFFVGAMGSGKTEIAINFAVRWSQSDGKKTGLIDLDMIKPYFRLRTVEESLIHKDVEVVIPRTKYGFADFPIISAELEAYVKDDKRRAVIDVGGDDLGARLMGRYHGSLQQKDIEVWYVFNARRPLSRGMDSVMEIISSVEKASSFRLTGIVHNSHLMGESTISILEDELNEVDDISKKTGLPIKFHCIREDLYSEASKRLSVILFPLKLYLKPDWF